MLVHYLTITILIFINIFIFVFSFHFYLCVEKGVGIFVRRIARVVRKLDKVGCVAAKHCSCVAAAMTFFWGGHPTVGFDAAKMPNRKNANGKM